MKKLNILLLLFLYSIISAQSFPYTREWGTYVGGGGTQIYEDGNFGNPFFVDHQNKVFLISHVLNHANTYPASYYNQFAISSGGYPFVNNLADGNLASNYFLSNFSTTGTQLYGAYKGTLSAGYERLVAIDTQGNKYIVKTQSGFISGLATSGAWLTNYTDTFVGTNIVQTSTFSKYDSAGNLLYTTYLPNLDGIKCYTEGDSAILVGSTNQEIVGISSPGVFQEHYINYNNATNYPNGFYVKLSPTGAKLIGSYFPTNITAKYHNGGLYAFTSINDLPTTVQQSLVTPGTFQQSGGIQVLCKFNADSGTLVWGTRIGTSPSGIFTEVYTFNVNETGIYLYGTADNIAGSYYATAGAFKTQITGDNDLFLTKFDDTGNRVWGTYLGGNGWDNNWDSYVFALKGNKIVIAGITKGTDNISTPGAFLTTPPNPSSVGNLFFTGFDSNGNQEFCSYYGGILNNPSIYAPEINTSFDHIGNLYLWGSTGSTLGFATSNGTYPNVTNPQPNMTFGYLVKFAPLEPEMSTSETEKIKDLVLFDNPNDGNFSISGSILEKQTCSVKIYDSAGRLITTKNLSKEKKQKIFLKGILTKGIYFVHLFNGQEKALKVFKMEVK